jgi:hypothetical protein
MVSQSEGTTRDRRGKENVRKWKILKQLYEYNIKHCTVSCWLWREHGDREWVSVGGLIWLKHNKYRPEVPR